MLSRIIFLAVVVSSAPLAQAAVIGTNTQARPLTMERIATLATKDQGAWQKYLRASEKQFHTDQSFLVAEMKKAGLSDSLAAPKGDRDNRLSLNEPAAWYGGAEGLRIADVVLSFQTPAGGWCKNIDMIHRRRVAGGQFSGEESHIHLSASGVPRITDWHFIGTFDNNATVTQLRFLAKVIAASEMAKTRPYRGAFLRGVEYTLGAQLPNGGWPQVWPLCGDYHDAITYNDEAMGNVLQLLDDIAAGHNEFEFTSPALREHAATAVDRGLQCILKTQIVLDGHRTGWCQQHDVLNLAPTAARNYEMPSVCSSESAGILVFLMKRPKPTSEIITAIHAGVAFLEKTKLSDLAVVKVNGNKELTKSPGAPPLWARYYDLHSLRPIFGDRDKTIHDDMQEISAERRNGYSWYSSGANRALQEYARWKKNHPPS